MDIPPALAPRFRRAGWWPSRQAGVDRRVPERHPAHAILRSLGGLRVGSVRAGTECATHVLCFGFNGEDQEDYAPANRAFGRTLIQVAEIGQGDALLLIDEAGRCVVFMIGYGGTLAFAGHDFSEAIDRLLLGRRLRPMLWPREDAVYLYGEKFTRGQPDIFAY